MTFPTACATQFYNKLMPSATGRSLSHIFYSTHGYGLIRIIVSLYMKLANFKNDSEYLNLILVFFLTLVPYFIITMTYNFF